MNLPDLSPMTDTRELHLLDLRPSVPSRYYTRRARYTGTLLRYGWLVGLLLAGVVGLVYGLTELQALTPTTAIK